MKLAEALILRADHQKRIEQLRARLLVNARVQEGEAPAENPQELIEELERVSDALARLIQRINATNAMTNLSEGVTLSEALANRDVLGRKQAVYRDLAQAAAIRNDRYTRSEVKFTATVNVAQIQRRADELAREHRELDARIQEANWQTELIE